MQDALSETETSAQFCQRGTLISVSTLSRLLQGKYMARLHPVILSGGVGSRLWPLSRSLFPKQLLALAGDNSLIQDTALRVTSAGFAKPLIVCNVEHRFTIAEQMRLAGTIPETIILEPMGRNTAPAAAVAALMLENRDPDA